MIIGISGRMGSGKSTVGEIIQKLCITNNGTQFEQKAFAGKLKQIASLLTGISVEKFEDQEFKRQEMSEEWGMTYRVFLQKLGTETMRNGLHENVWVNALFADVDRKISIEEENSQKLYKYKNIIITDMRFVNEMEAVKKRGGITIRVNRPCDICGGSGYHKMSCPVSKSGEHESENSLDKAEFDYVVDNNSDIQSLIEKVKIILEKENIL